MIPSKNSHSNTHAQKWLVLDAHGVLLPSSEHWILKHLAKWHKLSLWKLKINWLFHHIPSQTGAVPARVMYSEIVGKDFSKSQFEMQVMRLYKQRASIPKPIQKELQRLKKAGWKIALLSNMNDAQAHYHREAQTFKGFDEVFFSWEHHNMKPFPSFFSSLQHKLRARGNNILFIDDHWENIFTGMLLGWNSIKLREAKEVWLFLKDLK